MQQKRNRAADACILCLAPITSVALLIASTSAAAAVGSPLTPVIEISPDPTSPPSSPENWIARDVLGNFAVAWSVGRTVADTTGYIRWFATDGTPLTAAVPLPNLPLGLGMDDAGDAVVVYNCGSSPRIFCAQTYNSSGIPISAEIQYAFGAPPSASVQINLQGTSVGMSGSGDFTVAWAESDYYQYYAYYARQIAFTRTYHLDGTAVSPANTTVFNGVTYGIYNGYGHAVMGGLAVARDGAYALVASVLGYGRNNQAKFYSKSGAPTSLTITIPGGPNSSSSPLLGVSEAIAPNGDVLLAFRSYTFPESISVYRYSKYGVRKGQPLTAIQGPELAMGPEALSTTSDNGFMLTYGLVASPNQTGSPFDVSIATQVYNAENELQTTFNVATYTEPGNNGIAPINTVTDANNNLTVVWGTVKARVFQGP